MRELVLAEEHSQAEFRIVFKEAIRPGGASPSLSVVHGVVGRLPP